MNLDTIKAAWKQEKSFEVKKLSEADIQRYISRKSRDISRLFRKGLIFDMVLKSVIGISLIAVYFLYRDLQSLILISSVLLLILWALRFQWLMVTRIPKATDSDPVVRTTLEKKISYYHQHFIRSLYVGALSNSLFILTGILYYFYFKYGKIRPFTWDDYLVFGSTIIIAFALGAYAQIKQHNFQVKQLEECLQEIDEEAITTLTLKQQRNKKRNLILVFSLAIICGLLLLAFLIFR